MIAGKSGSGRSPSPRARSAATRAGQFATIPAMTGSGTQSISAAVAGPATVDSAATMSATVVLIEGRFSAIGGPNSSDDADAARSSPAIVRLGDDSATGVSGVTGQTARC